MGKPYRTVYIVPVFKRHPDLMLTGWTWEAVSNGKVIAYGRTIFDSIENARRAGKRALRRRDV